jgi:hypothetical protein
LKKLRKQLLHNFTTSIASAYRQSTHKFTLSDLNDELLGLDHLLQLKWRLQKLWQETRDPAYKTALNWVTATIHRMTQRKVIERWERKIRNCEVTPHAIWPLVKYLMKRDRLKAATTIHGPCSLKFLPLGKSNVTANCLENKFTPHNLCEENHKQQVEAQVQALSEAVDDSPPKESKAS